MPFILKLVTNVLLELESSHVCSQISTVLLILARLECILTLTAD